jgi:hypothetical protein
MAGARGICSSPLSSADEADADAFPEMSPSPAGKPARGKRKAKVGAKKAVLKSKKPKLNAERKSAKQLVQDSPQDFVEYLADQLSTVQQAKFELELGGGQGFVVKLPPASWNSKRKRDKLGVWLQALGFASGAALSRNMLRIASLKADVIQSELKRRMPSMEGYVCGRER